MIVISFLSSLKKVKIEKTLWPGHSQRLDCGLSKIGKPNQHFLREWEEQNMEESFHEFLCKPSNPKIFVVLVGVAKN